MQIGVDIGGTFTDIVALDERGRLVLTKVPTTPKDLLEGIASCRSHRSQFVVGRQIRSDAGQMLERKLRSGYEQLIGPWTRQAGARLVAAEQRPSALDEVQAIKRRKTAAVALAAKRCRRSPEDRDTRMQRRALGLLAVGDRLNRLGVLETYWVADDKPEIDVAHQRAEPAVREAP